jgi:hypothetical protein
MQAHRSLVAANVDGTASIRNRSRNRTRGPKNQEIAISHRVAKFQSSTSRCSHGVDRTRTVVAVNHASRTTPPPANSTWQCASAQQECTSAVDWKFLQATANDCALLPFPSIDADFSSTFSFGKYSFARVGSPRPPRDRNFETILCRPRATWLQCSDSESANTFHALCGGETRLRQRVGS